MKTTYYLDNKRIKRCISYCEWQIGRLDEFEKDEIDNYILADIDADRLEYREKIEMLKKRLK